VRRLGITALARRVRHTSNAGGTTRHCRPAVLRTARSWSGEAPPGCQEGRGEADRHSRLRRRTGLHTHPELTLALVPVPVAIRKIVVRLERSPRAPAVRGPSLHRGVPVQRRRRDESPFSSRRGARRLVLPRRGTEGEREGAGNRDATPVSTAKHGFTLTPSINRRAYGTRSQARTIAQNSGRPALY